MTGKPRHQYSVKIPPGATPEEIDAFMKEFLANWGKSSCPECKSKEISGGGANGMFCVECGHSWANAPASKPDSEEF